MIPAIILPVAAELLPNAFEVMASELLASAGLVPRITELPLVAAIPAVIVMVADPVLVQTAPVVTSELVLSARRGRGTVMQSDVLIGTVHAVRVSIAEPFLRDALRPVPHLIRRAGELSLLVALPIVTLVPFVLVGLVQAIIVPVADVDPRYTVAVIAREEVAEAGPAFGLAVARRFVAAVQTVVVAVAVPSGRDAAVIGAPEAVLRAGPLGAVQRVLVAVVPAIVVPVAEPVGLHADVGLLALEVVGRAGGVAGAAPVGLI